jgi:hypothetical protein
MILDIHTIFAAMYRRVRATDGPALQDDAVLIGFADGAAINRAFFFGPLTLGISDGNKQHVEPLAF